MQLITKEKFNDQDYEFISVPDCLFYEGDLRLINKQYPYHSSKAENLIPISNQPFLTVGNNTVFLSQAILSPLLTMLKDFHTLYPVNQLIVLSGYRTLEYQQQLWNRFRHRIGTYLTSKRVARPGCSEHHTGLCFDFTLQSPNGRCGHYRGRNIYQWINQNASSYGFIERYQKTKTLYTGIKAEPWHFRYVGLPHSEIMTHMNFCLEEYISFLENFSALKKHLLFTDSYHGTYEIYYTTHTELPCPRRGTKSFSGTNTGGIIVTTYLSPCD